MSTKTIVKVKNIAVAGIDIAPHVVDLANTGRVVISSSELNRPIAEQLLDVKDLEQFLKKSNKLVTVPNINYYYRFLLFQLFRSHLYYKHIF